MKEFDLYIKRSNGLWTCRGSYPSKEIALEKRIKKHKDDEYLIKESEKRSRDE